MEKLKSLNFWKSFALLLLLSILAKALSLLPGLSLIGHLVIALLLGMLVQASDPLSRTAKAGSGFISNKFLRLGIILMGFRLNLQVLAEHGVKTLSLAAVIIVFTIFLIYFLARRAKVEAPLAWLAASGCGICGAAAVLGLSPIIGTDEDDEVVSIAVVAILGTLFTLILVFLRPVLALTDVQYGVLAGGSLHEIAHAVAAGSAGGPVAESMATIMKLSRVLLLAPVAIIFGLVSARRQGNAQMKVPLPWFILGFVAASAIGTFAGLADGVVQGLVDLAYLFLGMAMAALGVGVNFKVVYNKGQKILLICGMGSLALLFLTYVAARLMF